MTPCTEVHLHILYIQIKTSIYPSSVSTFCFIRVMVAVWSLSWEHNAFKMYFTHKKENTAEM